MINIGVIGTGWARRFQLPALSHVDGIEVIAVTSGNRDNALQTAADFDIPDVCDDYTELVSLDEVDLVLVTTPPHLHKPLTLAAIANGKHVLCEKPLALNANEAEMIRKSAQQAGILGLIDHELRFNPTRQRLKGLLADGYVGDVRHVTVVYRSNEGLRHRDHTWWYQSNKGGGMLMAIGSHLVDATRWWLGEVVEVDCRLDTFIRERRDTETGRLVPVDVDDTARLTLGMESGAVVDLSLSSVTTGPPSAWFEIVGSEGWILLDESALTLTGQRDDLEEDLTVIDTARGLDGLRDSLWAPALVHQFRAIASALTSGEPSVPGAADFSDGVAVQQIIDAARQADSEKRRISF